MPKYRTGDKVWLEATHLNLPYQTPKLAPKRQGPFKIVNVVSPVAHRLQLPAAWNIHNMFHASLLTPYRETASHSPNFTRPPPDLMQGNEEFEVETIINHRFFGRRKALQYLIKWKGYPSSDNTWEPVDNVHAPEIVKQYHQRRPLEDKSKKKSPRVNSISTTSLFPLQLWLSLKNSSKAPLSSTSSPPLTVHLRAIATSIRTPIPFSLSDALAPTPRSSSPFLSTAPHQSSSTPKNANTPCPLPSPVASPTAGTTPPTKCLPLLLAMSLAPLRPNTSPARRPPMPHPSQSRSQPTPASPSADLALRTSSMPPHPSSLLHPHYLPHLLLSRSHRGPPATTRTVTPSPLRITSELSRPLSSPPQSPLRRVSTRPFTLRTLHSPPDRSLTSSRATPTSPLATYDPSLWVSSAPSTPATRDTASKSATSRTKSPASSRSTTYSPSTPTTFPLALSRTTVKYHSSSSPSMTTWSSPPRTSAPSTPLI